MDHVASVKVNFYASGQVVFVREYNHAMPEDIMKEFHWISELDGFMTPNGDPFEMAICYYSAYGAAWVKQWTLVVS